MSMNAEILDDVIAGGVCKFWCDTLEERRDLFLALTQLGYRWNSGDPLESRLNRPVQPDEFDGTRYVVMPRNKRVLFNDKRYGDEQVVSTIFGGMKSVDSSTLVSILEG